MGSGYAVGEIMVRDVATIAPTVSLVACARAMREQKVGCLVVTEGEQVVGILTEQDIARKVVAEGLDPEQNTVAEIMSRTVETISPDKDLQDAVLLMGNNEIKHLPVIHEGKLMGILTAKDIIFVEPTLIEKLTFNVSMQRQP